MNFFNDMLTQIVLIGFTAAAAFLVIYYFYNKLLSSKPTNQNKPLSLRRIVGMLVIGILLLLSPFIILFVMSFVLQIGNSLE